MLAVNELDAGGERPLYDGDRRALIDLPAGRSAWEVARQSLEDQPETLADGTLHLATIWNSRNQRRDAFDAFAYAVAVKSRLRQLGGFAEDEAARRDPWLSQVWQELRDLETDAAVRWYKSPIRHRSKAGFKHQGHQLTHQPRKRYEGLVGEVRLSNVGPNLMALLRLGEALHVGRSTSVGAGWAIIASGAIGDA